MPPSSRRIKVMAELDIAEKRIPQDGRFKLKVKGKTVDFRVSIMPTIHGEDCVIRILDKESTSEEFKTAQPGRPRLRAGGQETHPPPRRGALRDAPGDGAHGLAARPPPCTPSSARSKSSEYKMITIEDPVEYQLRGVTQIPVNEKKGLTFAEGPALDPPPRPGQDHGRRDPRRGDGQHRHPVGPHRPPRVHHGSRQQRGGRPRTLPAT